MPARTRILTIAVVALVVIGGALWFTRSANEARAAHSIALGPNASVEPEPGASVHVDGTTVGVSSGAARVYVGARGSTPAATYTIETVAATATIAADATTHDVSVEVAPNGTMIRCTACGTPITAKAADGSTHTVGNKQTLTLR